MEPITVRGRYFWQAQDRFVIRGVVYQRHRSNRHFSGDPKDPLCDDNLETVRRSVPLLKELGINTLLVYFINPAKSHDGTMQMLAEAGIYVMACLGWLQSTPAELRAPFYHERSLHRMFAAVDCMAAYPNTLGLALSKIMLVNRLAPMAESAPLMRAAARDVKRYMVLASDARNQRILPLGFFTEKKGAQTIDDFHYFTEGLPEEAVDFFAYDEYDWVRESSMAKSGYEHMAEQFAETRVPVFLYEFGGRGGDGDGDGARAFSEAEALHGPALTPVFSGGCAYEFFDAANRYGLVRADADGGALRPTADFGPLRARLAAASPPLALAAWAEQQPAPARADYTLPACPLDWESMRARVEDGKPFWND